MPTSNSATETKLLMCQDLGADRRMVTEIHPDDTVTTTCFDGDRQVGKPVSIRLSKAPRMAAIVDAVRRALGGQEDQHP